MIVANNRRKAALEINAFDGLKNLILGIPKMTSLAIGSSTVHMNCQHELSENEGTSKVGRLEQNTEPWIK